MSKFSFPQWIKDKKKEKQRKAKEIKISSKSENLHDRNSHQSEEGASVLSALKESTQPELSQQSKVHDQSAHDNSWTELSNNSRKRKHKSRESRENAPTTRRSKDGL